MSLELSLNNTVTSDTDACGNLLFNSDSRILSQSSWYSSWSNSTYYNTPYKGNSTPGRPCQLSGFGRGNFISEVGDLALQGITAASQNKTPTTGANVPQGCIAISGTVLNDKYDTYVEPTGYQSKMPVWGLYLEARQYADPDGSDGKAGPTFGMEIDLVSYGDNCPKVEPYGWLPESRAINYTCGVGGGQLDSPDGKPQICDASAIWVAGGNGIYDANNQYAGAKWRSGIVFKDNAFREPYYEAIVLCSEYNINWYSPDNVIGASISGDKTGNGQQMAFSISSTNSEGTIQEIAFNKFANNSLAPSSNVITLGTANNRWAQGFGVKGWTTKSDERAKQDITDIDNVVLNAWEKVNFQRYKLKESPDKWQIGVIAQQVIKAFASEGLNALDYEIVHYEEDTYSVCYEQALALECACLRRKLNDLGF